MASKSKITWLLNRMAGEVKRNWRLEHLSPNNANDPYEALLY
jgi:hypothetical protein